ncbi:MAG: hypothetical protein KJ955_03845 [Nanoarchaeota archaeon]|nr:hypothetical protein [Nanoarchaeota archaeon]
MKDKNLERKMRVFRLTTVEFKNHIGTVERHERWPEIEPKIVKGYIKRRAGEPFRDRFCYFDKTAIRVEGTDGYRYIIENPPEYYTKRTDEENERWNKKVGRRGLLRGIAYSLARLAVGAALLGGACYGITKACDSPSTEKKRTITLEDKCDDLNREKPMLRLVGQQSNSVIPWGRYTLECDKDGNPVLYEHAGEGRK